MNQALDISRVTKAKTPFNGTTSWSMSQGNAAVQVKFKPKPSPDSKEAQTGLIEVVFTGQLNLTLLKAYQRAHLLAENNTLDVFARFLKVVDLRELTNTHLTPREMLLLHKMNVLAARRGLARIAVVYSPTITPHLLKQIGLTRGFLSPMGVDELRDYSVVPAWVDQHSG